MERNRSPVFLSCPARVVAVLVAVAVWILPAPAGAQQYQSGAVHQYWTLPEEAWNVDTYLWPSLLSPAVFFTQQFWFNGGGLAYMGLQQRTEGMRRVRFSIWNATGARRSAIPGADCRDFGGEGVGKTCTIPYDFSTGRWYRLRIWRLNIMSYGTWWGGWVIDDAGNESYIGSILAPRGVDLITGTASFSEYYGTSVGYPCGRLPPSTVYFYQPILNNGRSRATIGSSNKLRCSAGRVTPLPLWNNTLSQLELGVTLVVVDDPTMRSVLVEIYHATGGPTWTTRTNWLSDQPIGTWHGVRTDAAGRVTHLQLPNNGLTGRIPDALRRLPRLEDLRLAGNDLVGPIPAWLETLPLLRQLWLNSNRLSGRIPAELGALTRLGHLSLDRNAGLRGPVPAEFGNLTTLWTLRLNHTGLTGPLPLALANLRSLNYMDVRNTGLCAPDDPAFQSWLRTVNAVNGGIATCTRRATP